MNLSPDWVGYLGKAGHDAVHWSSVGAANASDDEIVAWARGQDRVVLTSDLDFGIMLATSGAVKPSVIQLRSETTLPSRVGALVTYAIERAEAELKAGAVLTVEAGRLRLRILGLDQQE